MRRKVMLTLLIGYIIVASFILIGVSLNKAHAEDLVRPATFRGEAVLSEHYSPGGGALIFIDNTGDGKCNTVRMYGFLKSEEIQVLMAETDCEEGTRVLTKAMEMWKKAGLIPMIYDKDKGELVPYKEKD